MQEEKWDHRMFKANEQLEVGKAFSEQREQGNAQFPHYCHSSGFAVFREGIRGR
jgi:hypothetical protein